MASKYGAETTAEEIISDFGHVASNKYVIVTGANTGLGFETARQLVGQRAKVVIACRSESSGNEAVANIKKEFPSGDVTFLPLDLASIASIRAFASAYKNTGKPLDILINNAGVAWWPLSYTSDGLEMHFGVNHIGHFLLTTELLDVLKRSGTATSPARVIKLSSFS